MLTEPDPSQQDAGSSYGCGHFAVNNGNLCEDKELMGGGSHSSVVSSAPTILQPRVRIPSTPSMLFSICN